jgi:hypothetical protein
MMELVEEWTPEMFEYGCLPGCYTVYSGRYGPKFQRRSYCLHHQGHDGLYLPDYTVQHPWKPEISSENASCYSLQKLVILLTLQNVPKSDYNNYMFESIFLFRLLSYVTRNFVAYIGHLIGLLLGESNVGWYFACGYDKGEKACILNFYRETSWKCPLVRPRRGWDDNIKLRFVVRIVGGGGLLEVAQDLVQWRTSILAVLNHEILLPRSPGNHQLPDP